jgi:hypothetical protein
MADLEDQRRFDEIIRKLCENPGLGASVGTLIDVLPVVVFRYDEGIYRVSYDLPDDATVRIWMIGKGPE